MFVIWHSNDIYVVIYHCYSCHVTVICYLYICLCHTYAPHILKLCCLQVRAAETELRHKLFPPNAWIKILNFDVLTSCPKDELHQWFIGLYGEHIVPAIMYRYTQALQRPDLVTLDKNCEKHALLSNYIWILADVRCRRYTYDVVSTWCGLRCRRSRPTMSYVYDIVRHDLRHRHTTSYVPHVRCRNVRCAYDIIKTYDVARPNYNVVRFSSYAIS